MIRLRAFTLLLFLGLFAMGIGGVGHATLPDEQLADPVLEARARDIGQQLRCVVCQNQSIDDSDAPLARDLRLIVREQLATGASDSEVVGYLVERYGDFVRLRPPLRWTTALLWFGPLIALIAGLGLVYHYVRHRRLSSAPAAPLTPEEEQRLADLIEGE